MCLFFVFATALYTLWWQNFTVQRQSCIVWCWKKREVNIGLRLIRTLTSGLCGRGLIIFDSLLTAIISRLRGLTSLVFLTESCPLRMTKSTASRGFSCSITHIVQYSSCSKIVFLGNILREPRSVKMTFPPQSLACNSLNLAVLCALQPSSWLWNIFAGMILKEVAWNS